MNKYAIYGLFAVAALSFSSCSDEEEVLEPTVGVVENKFAVPEDATGAEADLRRSFYKNTGVYLIFNDLLSRDLVGTDANGKDVYKEEWVDFTYNLTSIGDEPPIFEYLENDEDKKAGAELIEKYLYPHLEGGKLMPFSIMPVETIEVFDPYWWEYAPASIVSCWRCLAVAVGEWMSLPEEEQEEYSMSVLLDLISLKFTYTSDEADEFSELSYEYSGEYLSDLDENWDRSDMSLVYELGYLSYVKSRYSAYSDYLPYTSADFNSYLEAVLSRDEADFMEEFGDYSKIVTKYYIIKNALIDFGYKF